MKKIKDPRQIDRYALDNDFYELFDTDVTKICELLSFDTGEFLISLGQPSEYLLFLVKGECLFYTYSESGEHISLGSAASFQIFGEVSSLWNLPPNNVVQAIRPTLCLALDLNKHRETLLNDNRFLRYICRLMSERVIYSNKALTSFVGAKALNRLASFILANEQDGLFNVRLTRCSEAIGVSYRHLLRIMDDLCGREILKKQKRSYKIMNRSRLNRLAAPAKTSD